MDSITFAEYQKRAHETAIYPPDQALYYLTLGLCGEAGEFANKVKKTIRDGALVVDLASELGDVLWYLSELCTMHGIELSDVAQANLDKLSDRQQRGVIRGNGDTR